MGGSMVLQLSSVERIVGDEIATGGAAEPTYDLTDVVLDFSEGETLPENAYAAMFVEVGRRHSLSPRFLASVAQAESAFEPWARSNKGAIGLMQVMPATAERFGVDPGQLYDPLICLDVGAQYLAHLRRRYKGDVALLLAAYNAGEATVERFGGVPPYLETQTYIHRVHRSYQESSG
jgi:soluble lytic murein transglycosylase-like protein